MDILDNNFMQSISVIALAVVAFSIGVQKLLKEWKSTGAETNVIRIMHEELARMGEQNHKLITEISKLQDDIIQLHNELSKLNIENNKLQQEVAALTLEVTSFKKITELRKAST